MSAPSAPSKISPLPYFTGWMELATSSGCSTLEDAALQCLALFLAHFPHKNFAGYMV